MLALQLAMASLQVRWKVWRYEISRWLLVASMLFFSVHYLLQMVHGLRAQGTDVGAAFNILFYTPVAFAITLSIINIESTGSKVRRYCLRSMMAYKDCYSYTDDPAFPPVEDEVVIEFKQGVPVKIDGHDVTPLQAIEEMNRRAGAQGIGRIDLIEDRLVGIKSRELYEAPGAVALITAHQELENCCLEREQHRIKRDIDKRWAELVYDAQWFSPATQSLNAFIEDTQKYVSGEIRMVLHGGRAVVTGRRSDSSLYDYNLATYDSGDSFDQKSSNGFIDIYGLPSRVAAARDVKFGNGIEVPENSVE